MSQKLFTHFLSRKRFTHSIWKVFARDTLPTGKVWLFMSLLLTISHRHLGLRLSSVPVVSTVEIQRAVSQEETSDQKDPGSVFSDFLLICWKLIFSDVLLTLTMGLGLTGGNKRNINFRMRPQPGDAMFRETCLNFVTDHQKHRKNCECCPGHSSGIESLYRAPATSRLD